MNNNKINKACDCYLKLSTCKSPIYITKGLIVRKPEEIVSCGKVNKLLEKLSKIKITDNE